MLELVIGGRAQGKLNSVKARYEGRRISVIECEEGDSLNISSKIENIMNSTDFAKSTDSAGSANSVNQAETAVLVINDINANIRELFMKSFNKNYNKEESFSAEKYSRDLFSVIDRYPRVTFVIITDEVGNGIVPLEKAEREYRDIVGSIQIKLAEKAEGVYRVICQLSQRIK